MPAKGRAGKSAGVTPRFAYRRPLEQVARRTGRGYLKVFDAFLTLATCALSAGRYEALYLEEAARWERPDLEDFARAFGLLVGAMEFHPYQDLLGPTHEEWSSRGGKQIGGEFYTPTPVATMMARMALMDAELPEDRPLELLEPACGAGGLVLAAAEVLATRGEPPCRMRVTAWDVSHTAVMMCYVNLTAWGVPATVIHGNALSLEVWGAYRNPFWAMARGKYPSEAQQVCELPGALSAAEQAVVALKENGALPQPDLTLPKGPGVQVSLFGEEGY
ncbi:N-6 DNA Methylase [Calidithermus terrae]|uniref:N-6 DNA Methylase n=1 Tax=Calidithermus terrae TaxID=1408545 RepID=A0A399F6Y9_9DEIN|nr:N-6 DNA methylase [Calidithermus terrae]RIH90652.1 N-6 DNA Methylase [Calidithermus terrae]